MADIIEGPVTRVIDGDTFEMQVTRVIRNNRHRYGYNVSERIRIADRNAPELWTVQGQIAKDELKNILLDRVVRCTVQARDDYGRIVARIE